MADGNAEYDTAKRDKIYKRCLTLLQEEAFYCGGFALPGDVAYKKYVKGYKFQWGMHDPRAVWLDK
jgi:ABC-type transport system substrate-binding protein